MARGGANGREEAPLHSYPAAEVASTICSHYGINAVAYNAVHWIAGTTVVMSAGKFVLFVDTDTGAMESRPGPADGAVGVVAVHPSREYYVVGERAPADPALRVYSWPSHELQWSLDGGAVTGFCACAFDQSGTRLATVSSDPDRTLAVWDWAEKRMLLRAKCSGSDVDTVAFSAFDNTVLVTGGSGHVKFWTMAETFTGLKLQGSLGKFGRLEISNVTGFAVLPGGRVVSGSESGHLLLWEGDLVHCSFARSVPHGTGGKNAPAPCHDGAVSAVRLLHDGATVVTAGDDGCVRYWSRAELEGAEGTGVPPYYAPQCLLETRAEGGLPIRSLTLCEATNEWIVLGGNGAMQRLPVPSLAQLEGASSAELPAPSPALGFNGGAITASAVARAAHLIATGGEDGVVRLVDYVRGVEVARLPSPSASLFGNPVRALVFMSANDLLVGHEDGTLRLVDTANSSLALLGQWRPHTGGLFAIALARDGTRLCTASCDGTVFFFNVDAPARALEALGFCRSPLPHPRCAEWDEHGDGGCLLGFDGGILLSLALPRPGEAGEANMFEYAARYALLGIRQRVLPPPAPPDLLSVELEEDMLAEKDDGPWTICLLRRLPDGRLAVGMDKEELLYTYGGTVRYDGALALPPLPPTGVEPPNYVEEPGVNLCYRDLRPQAAWVSTNGAELLVACDGAVVLRRGLGEGAETAALCSQAHDPTAGRVTGAHLSFDGAMVVTTSTDGVVVAQLLEGQSLPSPPPAASPPALPVLRAQEVEAPVAPALSIQQQKESDDKAAIEAARQARRAERQKAIAAVQAQYAALREENDARPPDARLDAEALQIDPTLARRVDEEVRARVREARKEHVVAAARDAVRTRKLRNRFVDNLLFDRMVLHSFRGDFAVASFRTVNPSPLLRRLEALIDSLDELPSEGESDGDDGSSDDDAESRRALDDAAERAAAEAQAAAAAEAGEEAPTIALPGAGESVRKQLEKMDERRAERAQRRANYEALLGQRPGNSESEHELATRMADALARRGDLVLRMDSEYKTSRDLRPTAAAKLRRLMDLERMLVEKRAAFNTRLLELRDRKRRVLQDGNELLAAISALEEEGAAGKGPQPLAMRPEEEPERRFDLSRDELDAFSKRRAIEKMREEEAKKAKRGFGADLAGSGGDGGGGGGGDGQTPLDADDRPNSRRHESSARSSTRFRRNSSRADRNSRASTVSLVQRERMDTELQTRLENVKPSAQDVEEQAMRQAERQRQRERLQAAVDELTSSFDRDLSNLLLERTLVDADLCLMEGRKLLLGREYELVLVYRARDIALREQLRSTRVERRELRGAIRDVKATIKAREAAAAATVEQAKLQRQEAEAFIEASFPADKTPYILKVFHRQIVRRKGADGDDDDDDITSDDEDDDDDDIGEEQCPAGCSVEAWEEMLALREQRLDLVDALADIKGALAAATKKLAESEQLTETLKQAIQEARQKMVEMESEKRLQLNELRAVVPLRLSQIRCVDEVTGAPPADLTQAELIVVGEDALQRLRERIVSMAQEKKEKRAELESVSAEWRRLQAAQTAMRKEHAEWEQKVYEVMMLKFGRRVDLEQLESCGTSRRVENKKEELRQVELHWSCEVQRREETIGGLRERMQDRLLANTKLLQTLGDTEEESQRVRRTLVEATTKSTTPSRGDAGRIATVRDRSNLRVLIAAQQEEMDALNAEIQMLRRKGGHVYGSSL